MVGVKQLLIVFILLLSVVSVSADKYYGDIDIFISDNGLVTIEGETNHESLLMVDNSELTSKDGSFWTLNLSVEGVFTDLIYTLHLPENADVNYLKTPQLSRIEHDKKSIIIIGTAEDQELELVVQYSINKGIKNSSFWWIYLLIIIFIIAAPMAYIFSKKKKSSFTYNPEALNERQKKIISLLMKNKGSMTQRELELAMKIPKSSVSRNVDSLLRRELIKKEPKGITNIITLKQG